MRSLIFVAAFFCTASAVLAAPKDNAGTARAAIKELPRGEYKRIVRIEARDGTPAPERWHIIVHDPKDENGVHEYVVAGGEVVASRAVSQFVESVKPEDVLKESLIKVDSDRVAALAQEYARANNVTLGSMNYALKKEGADAAPLWNVTCLDEAGAQVGLLVVSAGKGNVISHDGFTAAPESAALARAETQAESDTEREERRRAPRRPTIVRGIPVAPPVATPPERKGTLNRVGDSLGRFFTGRDRP